MEVTLKWKTDTHKMVAVKTVTQMNQLIVMKKIWVRTTLHYVYTILYSYFYSTDVDSSLNGSKSAKSGVERMLEFGRELFQMSQRLEKEQGVNETNQKMLEVIHLNFKTKIV